MNKNKTSFEIYGISLDEILMKDSLHLSTL